MEYPDVERCVENSRNFLQIFSVFRVEGAHIPFFPQLKE